MWKEFELYIKFPDNDLLNKEGDHSKVKTFVDLSKVIFFYESTYQQTEEKGVSLQFIGGAELFILCEYEDFKKLIRAFI